MTVWLALLSLAGPTQSVPPTDGLGATPPQVAPVAPLAEDVPVSPRARLERALAVLTEELLLRRQQVERIRIVLDRDMRQRLVQAESARRGVEPRPGLSPAQLEESPTVPAAPDAPSGAPVGDVAPTPNTEVVRPAETTPDPWPPGVVTPAPATSGVPDAGKVPVTVVPAGTAKTDSAVTTGVPPTAKPLGAEAQTVSTGKAVLTGNAGDGATTASTVPDDVGIAPIGRPAMHPALCELRATTLDKIRRELDDRQVRRFTELLGAEGAALLSALHQQRVRAWQEVGFGDDLAQPDAGDRRGRRGDPDDPDGRGEAEDEGKDEKADPDRI